MALTEQTLVACGVPPERARVHLPHMTAAMLEFGITTEKRARMFLAQVLWESGLLVHMEEIASGAAYEGRRDLGNTKRGDGKRYKGRGPIQLTGRANYRKAGQVLKLDLEGNPKQVATPAIGWRTSALYFKQRCNAHADRNDFTAVTKSINGGTSLGAPTHLRERRKLYAKLEGKGVTPEAGRASTSPVVSRDERRLGGSGDLVTRLTRRLSYVLSPKTGAPYLDGRRRTFDQETKGAIMAFQADHGLESSGVFGPKTEAALDRETRRQKESEGTGTPATAPPREGVSAETPGATELLDAPVPLAARIRSLDTDNDEVHAELLKRQGELERALARELEQLERAELELAPLASGTPEPFPSPASPVLIQRPGNAPGGSFARHAQDQALGRELGAGEPRSQALPMGLGAGSRDAPSPAEATLRTPSNGAPSVEVLKEASAGSTSAVAVPGTSAPPASPSPLSSPQVSPGAVGQPSPPEVNAVASPVLPSSPPETAVELLERVKRLDDAGDQARAALARTQEELARELYALRERRDRAQRELFASLTVEQLSLRLRDIDAGIASVGSALDTRRQALEQELAVVREAQEQIGAALGGPLVAPVDSSPPRGNPPALTSGQEQDGTLRIELGQRSRQVRESKVALARFIRIQRPGENEALRNALFTEARSGPNSEVATPRWQEGVRKAQELAGMPVTGILDANLHSRLLPHWKGDSLVRQAVRKVPVAWRAIRGQLTPNFNISEFACNDGTTYVDGLMREQGLSKKQARERATRLAEYLEELRKKEGDKPLRLSSVYRTKRYNKRVGGASDSAHMRGYAADVPRQHGLSLKRHRDHMRAVFPSGIGYYPAGNFIHGDFDRRLGRRQWNGP